MGNKNSKKKITILILIGIVIAVVGISQYLKKQRDAVESSTSFRTKGSDAAVVKIVEFVDFQCPACAAGAKLLNQFLAKYPQYIHLEIKYFPLRMHKHAFLAAQYAQCAGEQGQFWAYHDILFNKQHQWKTLIEAKPAFELFVKNLSLDKSAINACISKDSVTKAINEDKNEGKALGVKSTPSYFVNGKLVVGTKLLSAEINSLLPRE